MGFIVLAATFGLHQKLHIRADELLVFLCLDAILQGNETLETILDDFLGNLVLHFRSRGSRTRRVLEGKSRGKASAAHKLHGVLEVFLGLAWEAHDDIGRDSGVRNLVPYLVQNPQELLGAVGTAHVLKDLVGARLQRHMQLRAHGRGLGHGIDDVGSKLRWVRGGKAQALEAFDLAHLAQQLRKGETVAWHVGIGEIDAIGIDVLSQQGDLGYALVHQGFNLGQDIAGPTVLFLAAQGRNNAEGAGVIAAYRNRNPAGIGRLTLGWQDRRKSLEGINDFHLGFIVMSGALQQRRQGRHIVSAKDSINPRGII